MDAGESLAVITMLSTANIRCVVSGGWGIDALLGRETRPHRDIDLAVDADGIDEAILLLGRRGYALTADQRPARVELRAADDRVVDLHPVRWDADGTGHQEGFDGQIFVYPPGSTVVGHIGGGEVGCISPELQLAFHSGYQLQDLDQQDLASLAEALARTR